MSTLSPSRTMFVCDCRCLSCEMCYFLFQYKDLFPCIYLALLIMTTQTCAASPWGCVVCHASSGAFVVQTS